MNIDSKQHPYQNNHSAKQRNVVYDKTSKAKVKENKYIVLWLNKTLHRYELNFLSYKTV
jgi:hypothetical protein